MTAAERMRATRARRRAARQAEEAAAGVKVARVEAAQLPLADLVERHAELPSAAARGRHRAYLQVLETKFPAPLGRLAAIYATPVEELARALSCTKLEALREIVACAKARIRAAKKVLGAHKGGLIPLWRGASETPLAQAPAGDVVAICEGIEDALTVALHCPEWRVVACISVGNMGELTLPPAIGEVRLCFDRDGENLACAAARERAMRRYQAEGRRVFEMRPPEGFKDFNDWHMAELRGQRGVA
jgi:hypothetical protein